jgi:hypothetical protein
MDRILGRPAMIDRSPDLSRLCNNCGALDAHALGRCVVCYMPVCEKCGNIQHSHGERRVIHDACLPKDEGAFSMIRFV